MKTTRVWKINAIAGLVISVLAMTGCGAQDSAAGANDKGKESFVVGIQDPWQALPFHMAEKQGNFEAHGVDLEFQLFSSVTAMTAAVSSGDIDAAAQGIQVVAGYNETSDASDFLFFAPMQINDTVILARTGTGIPAADAETWEPTIKAFEGRTIGVPALGANADGLTSYMAQKVGMRPGTDLTTIAVGIGATAQAAMEQEQIDVVYELSRGMGIQLQKGLSYVVMDLAAGNAPEELSRLFGGGLFASAAQLDKRPEAYKALAAALAQTREAIADPANESVLKEIIASEYAPGDEELQDFLMTRSFIFSDVEFTDDFINRAVKGNAAAGVVGKDVQAEELMWKD
jgi:ABC-type nitrate/sulfonate/bicarbonate transport system substrate-binding protein